MKMNNSYRILKLASGDELITRITKRENGKVSMESPMIFRTIILSDPYTGMQKEITILKDWVLYTSDKYVKIPEDQIISYNTPLEEAILLYEKEKSNKDNPKKVNNMDSYKKDMNNYMKKFIDGIIENAENMMNPGDGNKNLADIFNSINGLEPGGDFDLEWEVEYMFPQEEISDETTENEFNHPDYGNRWTDWSSDPKQY